jgi:hypothetical protein
MISILDEKRWRVGQQTELRKHAQRSNGKEGARRPLKDKRSR